MLLGVATFLINNVGVDHQTLETLRSQITRPQTRHSSDTHMGGKQGRQRLHGHQAPNVSKNVLEIVKSNTVCLRSKVESIVLEIAEIENAVFGNFRDHQRLSE